MIEAVVIGLGRIGASFQRDPRRTGGIVTHAQAWKKHPATRLVAGVDPDRDRRNDFEDDFDVPAYPAWAAMIAHHSPRMVSVCTPPEDHAPSVLGALAGGATRVICEKPCTGHLDDARRLSHDLGNDHIKVGVNFTRRYDPMHRRLFSVAANEGVTSGFGCYTAGLLNTASHWFDGVLSAGAAVAEVMAIPGLHGVDPTPTVIARLVDGGVVTLFAGDVARFMIYETDLLTASGRVRLQRAGADGSRDVSVQSPRLSEYCELLPARFSAPVGLANALLWVIDDAVRSEKERRPMRCTVADAVRVHAVLEAVRESLITGGWVKVLTETPR
jgi:predicted dehydrogenase